MFYFILFLKQAYITLYIPSHGQIRNKFIRVYLERINGGRLIRLVCRGMRIGQVLFFLGIELGILRIRSWKELITTGAQTTWLSFIYFNVKMKIFLF